ELAAACPGSPLVTKSASGPGFSCGCPATSLLQGNWGRVGLLRRCPAVPRLHVLAGRRRPRPADLGLRQKSQPPGPKPRFRPDLRRLNLRARSADVFPEEQSLVFQADRWEGSMFTRSSVLAAATISIVAISALAPTDAFAMRNAFDGTWMVQIATSHGACPS